MILLQIFTYITLFLSIYAALNAYNVIYNTQLKSIPLEISQEKYQKVIFNILHYKNDFLTAYYYEFSFSFLLINMNLYLYLNEKPSTLLFIFQFISTICLFYFFFSVFYSYKKLYIDIAKKAFENNFEYKDYFRSNFLYLISLNEDIRSIDFSNINVAKMNYNDYVNIIINLNEVSLEPITESAFEEYKYMFDNGLIVVFNSKLSYIKDRQISNIEVDYSFNYFNVMKIVEINQLIKEKLLFNLIYLYIIYFILEV